MKDEVQDQILLNLLNAVERNSAVTQRTIAQELGIALGLANTYLRRCVRKGLVKIQQVPANRYVYYLTTQGFGEKSRLTVKYLSSSLNLFRAARQQCEDVIRDCVAQKETLLVLAGMGDLTEIALLCAREFPVSIVAIFDPSAADETMLRGVPVVSSLKSLPEFHAIIVTDMAQPDVMFRSLNEELGSLRVLAPKLLGLRPFKSGVPL
jgi:DNA-binding MarR family transcriptional regulator